MALIKNSGVPNRNTVGALGDIYTDVSTGLQYKCTGAATIAGQSDYEWIRIQTSDSKQPVKPEEVPVEVKPEVKEEKTVTAEETRPIQNPKQPKKERTDYNKQYNHKK